MTHVLAPGGHCIETRQRALQRCSLGGCVCMLPRSRYNFISNRNAMTAPLWIMLGMAAMRGNAFDVCCYFHLLGRHGTSGRQAADHRCAAGAPIGHCGKVRMDCRSFSRIRVLHLFCFELCRDARPDAKNTKSETQSLIHGVSSRFL